MNILITSANNKRALIEEFRSALTLLSLAGQVIAADSCVDVPAARFADNFVQQPEDGVDDYHNRWLQLCKDFDIDLIVPTRDGELQALANMAATLRASGTQLMCSPPQTLNRCLDKKAFYDFCVSGDFPVLPEITEPSVSDFPLFARPVIGSGSRSGFIIHSEKDIPEDRSGFLLQPFCSAPEYSIDVLFSLDGQPLQAVVRERVEVINGESAVTRVCDLPELEQLALDVGGALGLCGPAVIQCFYESPETVQLIECNPRFGGASMVSVHAGLASCERILLEMIGKKELSAGRRPVQTNQLVDRRALPAGVFL